jgi:hypothetical protein
MFFFFRVEKNKSRYGIRVEEGSIRHLCRNTRTETILVSLGERARDWERNRRVFGRFPERFITRAVFCAYFCGIMIISCSENGL